VIEIHKRVSGQSPSRIPWGNDFAWPFQQHGSAETVEFAV